MVDSLAWATYCMCMGHLAEVLVKPRPVSGLFHIPHSMKYRCTTNWKQDSLEDNRQREPIAGLNYVQLGPRSQSHGPKYL